MDEPLTPKQIENWKRVFPEMLMSDEQVQLLRDRMQAWADRSESDPKPASEPGLNQP